jgi:hypothetical protein
MVAIRRLFRRTNLDVLGFSASAICALHCLAVPLMLIFGLLAPSAIAHNHELENGILAVSGVLGSVSLIPSMVNVHRRRMPLLLFLAGMTAIIAGRFTTTLFWEPVFTVTGALLVAIAHYQNLRICRSCDAHANKQD